MRPFAAPLGWTYASRCARTGYLIDETGASLYEQRVCLLFILIIGVLLIIIIIIIIYILILTPTLTLILITVHINIATLFSRLFLFGVRI